MLRLVFAGLVLCHGVELVQVQVNQGWLWGSMRNVSTGAGQVYSFKGIPYAEPPIGSLRFKDPKPHHGWVGIRNATQHGSVCIQYDIVQEKYLNGSEDCLFLNVYTPTLRPPQPLPVMLFIHGGGWFSGSGDDADFGPDFLLPHGVILVTFNYRLDALGFLALHNKHVPGNAGMKDQVLALRWVRDNIKYFGGDRSKVTLIGQSAGSASVIFHTISPMSRGLFKRAIAMSGVPFTEWAQSFQERDRAFSLGRLLGKITSDETDLLQFLQGVEATTLVNTVPPVISQELVWINVSKMCSFIPGIEKDFGQERFLVENYAEAIKKRNLSDVDFLVGYTSEEFAFNIPRFSNDLLRLYDSLTDMKLPIQLVREIPVLNVESFANEVRARYYDNRPISNETIKELVHHQSDFVYIHSVNRFLRHYPGRSNIYFYKFSLVSGRNRYADFGRPYGVNGCAHTDDLRYLFDAKRDSSPVDVGSEEYRLINQVCSLFTNFAKTGNPTPPDSPLGVLWPAYDRQMKSYLNINSTLAVDTDADADVVEFWTNLYKDANIEMP